MPGDWGTGACSARMERGPLPLPVRGSSTFSPVRGPEFDILDTIHQVVNSSGLSPPCPSASARTAATFQELIQYANLSIEMALSRGRPGGHPQQVHL